MPSQFGSKEKVVSSLKSGKRYRIRGKQPVYVVKGYEKTGLSGWKIASPEFPEDRSGF